jgi:hypothetical protein
MEKYADYVAWCREQGCIFPSIEYPATFGPYNIVGARAKARIPNKKAFIFVPNKIIITPLKAKVSGIGHIISSNTAFFEQHYDADDLCLYLLLVFERLKGEASFWSPYFECVYECDLLMFWEKDLDLLQDPELKVQANVMRA